MQSAGGEYNSTISKEVCLGSSEVCVDNYPSIPTTIAGPSHSLPPGAIIAALRQGPPPVPATRIPAPRTYKQLSAHSTSASRRPMTTKAYDLGEDGLLRWIMANQGSRMCKLKTETLRIIQQEDLDGTTFLQWRPDEMSLLGISNAQSKRICELQRRLLRASHLGMFLGPEPPSRSVPPLTAFAPASTVLRSFDPIKSTGSQKGVTSPATDETGVCGSPLASLIATPTEPNSPASTAADDMKKIPAPPRKPLKLDIPKPHPAMRVLLRPTTMRMSPRVIMDGKEPSPRFWSRFQLFDLPSV